MGKAMNQYTINTEAYRCSLCGDELGPLVEIDVLNPQNIARGVLVLHLCDPCWRKWQIIEGKENHERKRIAG